MSVRPRFVGIVVGVVGLLDALGGLWFTITALFKNLRGDFSEIVDTLELSHFGPIFYTLLAVYLGCYALMLVSSIQLMRTRWWWSRVLVGVLAVELALFLLAFTVPLSPTVAGATNLLYGGLGFQVLTLFPLWAPWALRWAARHAANPFVP